MKLRPLGIPSFRDKIVQEAIRIILNVIYEPRFQVNFGFRPQLGCHDAISKNSIQGQAMTFAIEADVTGACDNVDHDIIINILSKKIDDPKFLNLIQNGLKSGAIYLNFFTATELGITQGSVCSPILYNINFHEFEKFIEQEIKEKINQKNITEKRTAKPENKLYKRISYEKRKIPYKKQLLEIKDLYQSFGKENPIFQNKYKEFLETRSAFKELQKRQLNTPYIRYSSQSLRYCYVRYADDWVFLINSDFNYALELKSIFTEWIKSNLKLELSEKKTKVTNLKKGDVT